MGSEVVVSAEAVGSEVKDSGVADLAAKDSTEAADSVVRDSTEAAVSVARDSTEAAVSVEKVVKPESILDVLSEGSWDKTFAYYSLRSKYIKKSITFFLQVLFYIKWSFVNVTFLMGKAV